VEADGERDLLTSQTALTRQCLNAGSVGKSKDNDNRACYVILSSDGEELDNEFIRVSHDIERAAKGIQTTAMPNEFAEMLRGGN
jgi:hypothetical protein